MVDFPTDTNGTLWKRQLKGSILVSSDWTTYLKADFPKAHAFYSPVALDVERLSVVDSICTRARLDMVSLVSMFRQKSLRRSSERTCFVLAGTSRSSSLRRRSAWSTQSTSGGSQRCLNTDHCIRYSTTFGPSS